MKLTGLVLAASLFLHSCAEGNLKNDPDLDDNKTDYPPPVSEENANVYPSDSTVKDSVY